MPLDQQCSRRTFQKLERQLSKLGTQAAPESVHRFRTYGRRVEALLDGALPKPGRNERKLLRLLARLRKKAGKVRDLDVQISALRNFKIPVEADRKSQLLRVLSEERTQSERKLRVAFSEGTLRRLRKRLKRASAEIPQNVDPMDLAKKQLQDLGRLRTPVTEKILHRYRIAGKRARYLAELGGKNPEAERMVQVLKQMQDVVGDWHDWLKLMQRAEKMFGGTQESSLVSALRNVTQAKVRHAVLALEEAGNALAIAKPETTPARKPATATAKSAAAAA